MKAFDLFHRTIEDHNIGKILNGYVVTLNDLLPTRERARERAEGQINKSRD